MVLGLIYGPIFTSVHDQWKGNSFGNTNFCWQRDVSAFEYSVLVCHSFPSKEQLSFNLMAAVTIHSEYITFKEATIRPIVNSSAKMLQIKWQ